MNPSPPELPPSDPEVRITALLLGELDEAEAAKVQADIASKPELARLYHQIQHALPLVREACNSAPSPADASQHLLPRISEPKRSRLLSQLANPATPLPAKRHRPLPWYVPMSLAAGLAGLLTISGFLLSLDVRESSSQPITATLEVDLPVHAPQAQKPDSLTNLGFPMLPPASGAGGSLGGGGGFGGFGGGASTRQPVSLTRQLGETSPGLSGQLDVLSREAKARPEEIKLQVSRPSRDDGKKPSPADAPSAAIALGRSLERKDKSLPPSAPPGVASVPQLQSPQATRRGVAASPPPASTPQLAKRYGLQDAGHSTTLRSMSAAQNAERAAGRPPIQPELPPTPAKPAEAEARGGEPKPKPTPTTAGSTRERLVEREMLAVGDELAAADADVTQPRGEATIPQGGRKTRAAAPETAGRLSLGVTLQPAEPSITPPPPASTPTSAFHYNSAGSTDHGIASRHKDANEWGLIAELESNPTPDTSALLNKLELQESRNLPESKPAIQNSGPAIEPQPEVETSENPFSTFSLNVSDVSFRLAAASLEQGSLPSPSYIRSEEFINAFDYRDPLPTTSVPVAFAWQRSRYPFAHDRELLRISVRAAAAGREASRPLNLVLCLDNSGSMERADRVQIMEEAVRVLTSQLKPQDKVSVVTFARTARLWISGLTGNELAQLPDHIGQLQPEGGTNLEDALRLAYETALSHYSPTALNRVVLLTDGAANLGDVSPVSLQNSVERHRRQGIALDCFGVGWEGYNDALLEQLARHGDGRYGFLNRPDQAPTDFAARLAGALQVAASDVKVQVEFNPNRVRRHRQVGYAQHQLTREQFRDNAVDAAEIGAAESGNSIYILNTDPRGAGPIATVRVRYLVPGTEQYHEHAWLVPYDGNPTALESSPPNLRLAATASAFSEWLSGSPHASEITLDALRQVFQGVPEDYRPDPRPQELDGMILQAKRISGQ